MLRAPDGLPLFPLGAVGSISHKLGVGVAAVALSAAFEALGVDLEWDSKEIPDEERDLQAYVASPEDRISSTVLSKYGMLSPGTWSLSAKEASYKAFYRRYRKKLDFADIALEGPHGIGEFRAVTRGAWGVSWVTGLFGRFDGWLVCLAGWRLGGTKIV